MQSDPGGHICNGATLTEIRASSQAWNSFALNASAASRVQRGRGSLHANTKSSLHYDNQHNYLDLLILSVFSPRFGHFVCLPSAPPEWGSQLRAGASGDGRHHRCFRRVIRGPQPSPARCCSIISLAQMHTKSHPFLPLEGLFWLCKLQSIHQAHEEPECPCSQHSSPKHLDS